MLNPKHTVFFSQTVFHGLSGVCVSMTLETALNGLGIANGRYPLVPFSIIAIHHCWKLAFYVG